MSVNWMLRSVLYGSINLLLAILVAVNAEAAESDVLSNEGLKISRFQEPGEFVWCGAKYLAISKHSRGADAGIRLLDIEDGRVRQLTTVKTHRVVACTSDGRHIFFVENGVHGVMNELDVEKGKQRTIYSKNLFQHEVIEEFPISPSGEFLIGPFTLKEPVTLSDRAISEMHVPDEFAEKHVSGIAWSGDGTVFLVIGSDFGDNKNNPQKLLILKSGNGHHRAIDLPSIKNAQFMQAGWSDVVRRLYLLSWRDTAKLYELDPEMPVTSLRLIATDVDEFKMMPNGNLVFVQSVGAAHRLLMLRTPQGQSTALLKLPYQSFGISGIQVSPNGDAIAVRVKEIGRRDVSSELQVITLR